MNKQEEKACAYYAGLTYEQQRRFLISLQDGNKKPPYYIGFKLDSTGLVRLGKVTAYCKKRGIKYIAEKAGPMAVKFRFNGMSERNAVLIGQMTK